MKNTIKFFLLFLLAGAIVSCKKNISEIMYQGGTAPVLSANKTIIPLAYATQNDEALTLSWTNPTYKLTSGPSSQDVSYTIEIDTTGSNFTNPSRKTISVARDMTVMFTQNQLNDYLLNQLNLKSGMPHNIEMRVTSSLTNSSVPLPSNVLKYTITPYAIPPKVTPPGTPVGNPVTDWVNGELYLVGNATPGGDATGWNNPVPTPSQKFTKVNSTFYTITIALIPDKSYLLLPVNGSWNQKFGNTGANNSNDPLNFDFKDGGGDIKAPGASGNYKIDVDFQRGKILVTKL